MVAPPTQAAGGSLPVASMGVLGSPVAERWSSAPPAPGTWVRAEAPGTPTSGSPAPGTWVRAEAPGTPTPGSPAPRNWVRGHMLGGGSQVVYLANANQVMNKIKT